MEQIEHAKKVYVEKTMFMCDVPVSAPMGRGGSLNESSLVGNLQRRNQANLFQTGLVSTAGKLFYILWFTIVCNHLFNFQYVEISVSVT